jgi:hypothetical protein
MQDQKYSQEKSHIYTYSVQPAGKHDDDSDTARTWVLRKSVNRNQKLEGNTN